MIFVTSPPVRIIWNDFLPLDVRASSRAYQLAIPNLNTYGRLRRLDDIANLDVRPSSVKGSYLGLEWKSTAMIRNKSSFSIEYEKLCCWRL